jgi:Tol biopolymer transport system component
MRYKALPILLGLLLLSDPAAALDPNQVWRTIVTPHFYVHYYRNLRHDEREMAQRVARSAEKCHEILVPLLGHAPRGRTHIVVTDDTDGANGSAQVLPMNIVRVFITGPSSISSLNDFDDHIYGLLLHEYTHILHIDTISGLPRLVNAIFGKTWAPNQIQPRWFIEGIAVYHESAHTAGGRTRNAIYDMYLRAAVLEGKLLEMDQISSMTRYYPRGTVPYLYGGLFAKYIADRHGPQSLTAISQDYGGSPIPYAINRTARETTGESFLELYDEFKAHLRRRYALQREAVQSRGLTPFRKVTDYGEACGSPRFSADGKQLIFWDTDGRSQFAVRVLDVDSGKIVEKFDILGPAGVDLTPDGEQIVMGKAAVWETFYNYHDLYVRDRRTGRERRLTDGLRARDPAVSPDGSLVAFTTNELGSMSLALIPFGGGKHRVLYRGRDSDQIFTPRWSPDGRQLVYSRWRAGGNRDIYLMDVASRRTRRLTDDRALDMDPMFSADGRRVYFSSDRSGIYNIYCKDLQSGETWQVTNLLGGAFVPAVSPDERQLYYVGFSYKGHDLHAMPIHRERYLPAMPYVNDRPPPPRVPPREAYPEVPYSPLSSVLPRAWSLLLSSDGQSTIVGIEVRGGDVVGRHAYWGALNINTSSGVPSYGLNYTYSRLWPYVRLDHSRFEGQRGGISINGVKGSYKEVNWGAGLTVGLPVLRIPNHSGDITLGYRFNYFQDADDTRVLVGPDHITPQLPDTGVLSGLTVGLSYSSLERYAWSISTEKGRAINVNMRANHSAFGSKWEHLMVSWSWREYVPIPWFDDHVLALSYGGGISSGDAARRGVFYIGGFPEQDVLRVLFDISRPSGVYLRGYPPGSLWGEQYHLLNFEYRLPIVDIEKGLWSLPVYLNNIHAAAFVDVGNAFYGAMDFSKLKVGVGGEVLVEMVIGYVVPTTFRIGYARGLMEPGGDEFHFVIGRPF